MRPTETKTILKIGRGEGGRERGQAENYQQKRGRVRSEGEERRRGGGKQLSTNTYNRLPVHAGVIEKRLYLAKEHLVNTCPLALDTTTSGSFPVH